MVLKMFCIFVSSCEWLTECIKLNNKLGSFTQTNSTKIPQIDLHSSTKRVNTP